MTFIQSVWRNYVLYHFHVAFCILLFLQFQYKSVDAQMNTTYALFLFIAVVTAYNLHDITDFARFNFLNPRHVLVVIGFTGMSIVFLFLPAEIRILAIPPGLLTLIYTLPVLPGRKKLRDINKIKIFVLAAILAFSVTIIPFQTASVHSSVQFILFISKFIFFFLIALLFDIRDMENDKNQGLLSLPVLFGLKKMKIIAYLLLFTTSLLEFYLAYNFIIDMPVFIAYSFTGFAIFLFFVFINNRPKSLLFSFLADGIMTLPYLFLVLLR